MSANELTRPPVGEMIKPLPSVSDGAVEHDGFNHSIGGSNALKFFPSLRDGESRQQLLERQKRILEILQSEIGHQSEETITLSATSELPPVDEILRRLDDWADIRNAPYDERPFREGVIDAVTGDISCPVESGDAPWNISQYRKNIDQVFGRTMDRLNDRLQEDGNKSVYLSDVHTDTSTGEQIATWLRRLDGGWVSEEVVLRSRWGGSRVRARAIVRDDRALSLTLNYPRRGDEDVNTNPKLINCQEFPTAAKVLFLQHAASVNATPWSDTYRLRK